jgi:hypothetical protein
MKRLEFTCALAAALCAGFAHPARAGNPVPIVQAFAGISAGNGTLPCANPGGANGCYGIPDGSVVVMPNQILSENAAGVYYAVFETANWSGSLSVTFQIAEAGTVVQTATASGTANANSVTLISTPTSFPANNGYQGLATMSVTTAAMPFGGGAPLTLRSGTIIQVRPPGNAITKVLTFTALGYACWNPPSQCSYLIPKGAVLITPEDIFSTKVTVPQVYSIVQTGYWVGSIDCTWQVNEGGTTVGTSTGTVSARNDTVAVVSDGIGIASNGYLGPALLGATCTATASHGPPATFKGYTLLQVTQ